MRKKLLFCQVVLCSSLLFTINFSLHAAGLRGQTIQICDDGAEWPPYTYYKRVEGKKTEEVIGFSVDVIREIFTKHGIRFQVDLPPWARCLQWLKKGQEYQMALNVSYNADRAATYHLSRPYYSTTGHYFYSKVRHPKGMGIRSKTDLRGYEICGLHGYNYTHFGLKNEEVDQNTKTFPELIERVLAGHCNMFIALYEILVGFGTVGENLLGNPDLGHAPVPGVESTRFYMLISRNYEQADELKRIVDTGLQDLEKSGRLQVLLKKYIPQS